MEDQILEKYKKYRKVSGVGGTYSSTKSLAE